MQYRDLAHWILHTMRMSEVYQPAAIIGVIYRGGTASLAEIHQFLELRRRERNPAVAERSLPDTREMPCKVLVSNGVFEAVGSDAFRLTDFGTFTPQQLTAIIAICEDRIADWNRNRPPED